jgi:hypothetical protein
METSPPNRVVCGPRGLLTTSFLRGLDWIAHVPSTVWLVQLNRAPPNGMETLAQNLGSGNCWCTCYSDVALIESFISLSPSHTHNKQLLLCNNGVRLALQLQRRASRTACSSLVLNSSLCEELELILNGKRGTATRVNTGPRGERLIISIVYKCPTVRPSASSSTRARCLKFLGKPIGVQVVVLFA